MKSKPSGPPLRFSGRLYYAAQRMQRLSERINELESKKLLAKFAGEMAAIENSVTEFEFELKKIREGGKQ